MILVAGGSGRLGTLLVRRLSARGLDVRVLTRDPLRAQHLAGVASEIVVGDVRERSSLRKLVEEAETVVSAVHGFPGKGRVSPASVDRDGNANLIDVAAEKGAHVVLLSVVGASRNHAMELFRAKWAAEQHLRASAAPWTVVRATAYLELWAEIMAKPIVFGRGRNPINFVSVHDVAAVVERCVLDPALRGRVLEVGGPEDLTFLGLAELLQQLRGEKGSVRHVPRLMLRAGAPFSRRASAALTMDSIDMTFDAAAARGAFADIPSTDARSALSRALTEHAG
ncbi:MAG: SDR family oxidoreductase [Solirubrobacterales bacterium]|nr:SDR family oxidoreductase [Solirubrobacterales bacterium]